MNNKYLHWIREILASEDYLDRLKYFHDHYPNVKCELRYRDAILEVFNARHRAKGIVAYAEVGKVDLAIFGDGSGDPFRIEFKYQYTFDMATRVGNELNRRGFKGILANAEIPIRERNGTPTVAEKIVRDCRYVDCDCFILVVQDRTGHPPNGTLHGGVEANFIEDQRTMDSRFVANTEENKNAWLTPTNELLTQILSEFGGESIPPLELRVADDPAPLTSHFFVLDMTRRHPPKAA